MNWYIVIILFQVSTATDGFYRKPAPTGYEMFPKPYTVEIDCRADATATAAQKQATLPVPYIGTPGFKTQYAGTCVQI